MKKKKVCRLINDKFNWALIVDGIEVRFDGSCSAEYFAEHYKSLGYKVEWDNEAWKRDEKVT